MGEGEDEGAGDVPRAPSTMTGTTTEGNDLASEENEAAAENDEAEAKGDTGPDEDTENGLLFAGESNVDGE